MKNLTLILVAAVFVCQVFAAYDLGGNFLTNGNAELGDLSSWNTISNVSVTSTNPAGGTYAFETTGVGVSYFVHNSFAVDQTKPLLLTMDYKTTLGAPVTAGASVAYVRYFDNANAFISQDALGLTQTDGVWMNFQAEFTPPAGAAAGDVFIYIVEENNSYIDNVGLFEVGIVYYTANNLIRNGDAESLIDFESWYHKAAPFTSVNRTDSAASGTSCFEMDNTSNVYAYVDMSTVMISVDPNEQMMLKFYYKTLPEFNAIASEPISVFLRYWATNDYTAFRGQQIIYLGDTGGNWVEHVEEFTVASDLDIAYLDVVLFMNYPNYGDGVMRWDDFELYSSNFPAVFDTTNNLFLNGDAEFADTTQWSYVVNVSASASVVEDGTYSFEFGAGVRADFVHNSVSVTGGEELLLKVSSYTAPSVTNSNSSFIVLRYFNSGGSWLGQDFITLPITNGNWVSNTIQAVIPETAAAVDVYISSEFNGPSYIDNVGLYRIGSMTGPFDTQDLSSMAGQWLADDYLPLLPDNTLDDFESYTLQADMENWWGLTSGSYASTGSSSITLLTSPAQAHSGNKALSWSYDNTGSGRIWTEFHRILASAVDLGQYDQMHVWINKHAGNSQEELFYVKFYNDILDETSVWAEAWITAAQGSTSSPVGWSKWVIDLDQLHFIRGASDKGDLDNVVGFFFGVVGDTNTQGLGSGVIDIDQIYLVNTTPNCGSTPPDWDLSGDCVVNLFDFAILAEFWMGN